MENIFGSLASENKYHSEKLLHQTLWGRGKQTSEDKSTSQETS
jgi:hypothetical protein